MIEFGIYLFQTIMFENISTLGVSIIAKSRWFNGVSAYLTQSQLESIKKLVYVSTDICSKKIIQTRLRKYFTFFMKTLLREYVYAGLNKCL